ncbi:MAG: hypothetical protein M3069_05700 [Chloroflexota bacterium]|nr:hypothetical protein [Chloroflexota bacterium]
MERHWESWLLRLALLATAAYQIISGNRNGATVAAEGLVVSFVPIAVARLSGTHIPRPLEFAFVFGMALQFLSESTKLFELFTYWDKLVHPTLIAITAMIATWFLLGYRDALLKRIPLHFVAAFGLLLGMSVGAFWEFVEFGSDWFGDANLQKSNADTLTDIVSNDIGALVATLFGLWVYAHRLSPTQRRELGLLARWLAHGPSRLFARQGRLIGAVLALLVAGVLFFAQWIDRNPPALASGLASGQSHTWTFGVDPGSMSDTQVLSGDWVPDERGICRENLEHPQPGSEKLGVLELSPGKVYGADGRPFSVQARYFEERPPPTQGTEMDAGIAFGIRDDKDFDLLEQSALHDIVRLDHYIHGKRRDVREKLFRTHGNEWHILKADVAGGRVTASVDSEQVFSADNIADSVGGVGLWARAAAATCFSDVQIESGQP